MILFNLLFIHLVMHAGAMIHLLFRKLIAVAYAVTRELLCKCVEDGLYP